MAAKTIEVHVRRQESPEASYCWERFMVPYKANMNVISCLMEIQRQPVTIEGTRTSPVAWDCNCLEEVCGACTMVVNGKVRQACSALIDKLDLNGAPVVLEPMTKFPLVRDLCVDRTRMFESLKKVKAWIPVDGTYDLGPGPRYSPEVHEKAYDISRCMTCGCCLEVCPQVNERTKFMGAAPLAQVVLFNSHPTGAMNAHERLDAVMGEGGLSDCGNAQACVAACPKEIHLTEAIADLGRQTTMHWLKSWFHR